jgi:hypothetical protein
MSSMVSPVLFRPLLSVISPVLEVPCHGWFDQFWQSPVINDFTSSGSPLASVATDARGLVKRFTSSMVSLVLAVPYHQWLHQFWQSRVFNSLTCFVQSPVIMWFHQFLHPFHLWFQLFWQSPVISGLTSSGNPLSTVASLVLAVPCHQWFH